MLYAVNIVCSGLLLSKMMFNNSIKLFDILYSPFVNDNIPNTCS